MESGNISLFIRSLLGAGCSSTTLAWDALGERLRSMVAIGTDPFADPPTARTRHRDRPGRW